MITIERKSMQKNTFHYKGVFITHIKFYHNKKVIAETRWFNTKENPNNPLKSFDLECEEIKLVKEIQLNGSVFIDYHKEPIFNNYEGVLYIPAELVNYNNGVVSIKGFFIDGANSEYKENKLKINKIYGKNTRKN